LKAALGILCETATDQLRKEGRNVRKRWRLVVKDGVAALDQGAAGEWALPGEHFVQDGPEAEDVRSSVDALSADLLRRHVRRGSQDGASLRPPTRWGNGIVENPV
jgi:hypothetical protein